MGMQGPGKGLPTRRSLRESKKPEVYSDDVYHKPDQHDEEDVSQQQPLAGIAPADAHGESFKSKMQTASWQVSDA